MVSLSIAKIFFIMITSTLIVGVPTKNLDVATLLENGKAAQKLNAAYRTLKVTDACIDSTKACIMGSVASCQSGSWVAGQGACSKSQACFALPSNQKIGTLVTCTTESNALSAIEATEATGGIFGDSTTMHGSTSSSVTAANDNDPANGPHKDGVTDCNKAPVSLFTATPSETLMTTSTRTITKDDSQTTIAPSATSLGVVTLTMTIGDEPMSLVPITSTLCPEQASSLLLQLVENGAIINGPSTSVTSSSPKSSITPPGLLSNRSLSVNVLH